jgi:hypothetical protein
MRPSNPTLLGLALSATTSFAQQTMCSGLVRPNWDDCNVMLEPFLDGPGSFAAPAPDQCNGIAPTDDQNCIIRVCPYDNTIPIDVQRVEIALATLRATCEFNNAGGSTDVADPNGFKFQVTNNPDFKEAAKKQKREHSKDLLMKRFEDGVSCRLSMPVNAACCMKP